jgi:hypothetical protein
MISAGAPNIMAVLPWDLKTKVSIKFATCILVLKAMWLFETLSVFIIMMFHMR